MAEINSTAVSEGELDALWAAFLDAPALLSADKIDKVSRDLFGKDTVRTVRATLLMLTKSGAELLEVMHSDEQMPNVFRELIACGKDHAKHLREVAEVIEAATGRLNLALCDAPSEPEVQHAH